MFSKIVCKHGILLNKIEFSCVESDINFVYWVTEEHNGMSHIEKTSELLKRLNKRIE